MRRLSLITLALSLATIVGCGSSSSSTTTASESHTESSGSQTAEAAPRFAMVTVDQVATRVESHDAHLAVFDANSRETFDEHHVPGAHWVDYHTLTASELPADHATSLVFYCANEQCSASHHAADAAVDLGFTDVSVMGGGIQGWIAAGKPVEAGAAPATPPS
jgi:rhodanese-related sulfurtransferase